MGKARLHHEFRPYKLSSFLGFSSWITEVGAGRKNLVLVGGKGQGGVEELTQ